MTVSNYLVSGMTCGHCASSVREEIAEIAGVTGVEVDIRTGAVEVSSESALDADAVANAVTEAGYQLVR
ncbi:heavy-metal-associated domain-containing protein [Gordonia sp. CPCC 205333]|uniref:heavy-metal-associated domain-containing protein n=1 Tax=Gordonia sp. CPCC 205333 TaxID=3140790 RepID=UPI003AF3C18D